MQRNRAPRTLRSPGVRKCPIRHVVARDRKPENASTRLLEVLEHLRVVEDEIDELRRVTAEKEARSA